MSSKGAKSHNQFGTSRIPVPINNFIRGKNGLIEMAGIQHNAVSTIVKNDAAAPWNYHGLEGAAYGVYENFDERFHPESPIDAHVLEDVVNKIVSDYEKYRDQVVIDNGDGTSSGRLVAVFEFIYFPKELGCARHSRVMKTQQEINEGFVSGSLIPDCLVRALCREMDRKGYEYVVGLAEGEATVVAQYNYGVFQFCIMSSEDVDARGLMLWPNAKDQGYLIYPRRQYQKYRDANGNYYPSGTILGVVVSDDDYIAPVMFTGSAREFDISFFTSYDRLVWLLIVGSDYVHAKGSGYPTIYDAIITVKGPTKDNISPTGLIKGVGVIRKWSPAVIQDHLNALMAYVLHPVPRQFPETPGVWYATNLVRVDKNEVISGHSILDIIDDALPAISDYRDIIIRVPFIHAPTVESYRFRNDKSCNDLNPGRIARENVATQISQQHPPLSESKSFFFDLVKLPRMDPSVVLEYSQRNPFPTNGFPLGQRRMLTVLKTMHAFPNVKDKLRWAYGAEKDTAGNPIFIFITFPVPRKVQLEEVHQCWVKCSVGFLADPEAGGDTLQMSKIIGFYCGEKCTLKLTSDCSHGVAIPPLYTYTHTTYTYTTPFFSAILYIYIYYIFIYLSLICNFRTFLVCYLSSCCPLYG